MVVSEKSSENLCLECGLCCNGVIFADVELNSTEAKELKSKIPGLRAAPTKGQAASAKLPQPCAALDGCRCRIYSDRPTYCRQFECLLLKNVQAGRLNCAAALRVIRTAQHRADKVRGLLRELGDTNEEKALSHRFQRAAKQFETAPLTDANAQTYADLTLAVHELNLLLSEAFYPG
jgi:Fe-S-cluster containining protein